MKGLAVVLVVIGSLTSTVAMAQSIACGIRPIPPIGCRGGHCVCSSNNQCQWVFDC